MNIMVEELGYLGYPGYSIRSDGYLINKKGRVLGGSEQGQVKLLKEDGKGFDNVKLDWLVATVFVENPDDHPRVRHIDGNKHNNRWDNLQWVPSKQRYVSKANDIRMLLDLGMRDSEIAYKVNTSTNYVAKIREQHTPDHMDSF